jgi:hypothetical protein
MEQDRRDRFSPVVEAARMVAAAVASAALTATLVIAVGQAAIERSGPGPGAEPALVRAGG